MNESATNPSGFPPSVWSIIVAGEEDSNEKGIYQNLLGATIFTLWQEEYSNIFKLQVHF
jgi:hypothetical protein